MNIQDYKNIWVFIETERDDAKNVGLELINQGKSLATANDEKVVAVVIGQNVNAAVQSAAVYGADEVILVEGEEYKSYNTDSYTNALVSLVEKYKPSVLLMGATNNGADLSSRVACRLKVGSASFCTEVVAGEDGTLTWTKPIYGGNLLTTVSFSETRPQIGTVRPGSYKKGQADSTRTANVIKEDIQTPADQIRAKVIELIKSVGEGGIKLEEADVVVAGGRGIGKAENISLIKELADLLGGAIGGTRACVDAEWITPQQQIGQSGKRVSPKLYIGCGISGATQHLSGITSSDVIVAINKDPDAPIFEVADYGVVGDLFEVVPVLIEEIRKLKAS